MTRDYTTMKRMRHAAALAMMGWYLMSPPMNRTTGVIYYGTPLSAWSTAEAFDTAAECSQGKESLIARTKQLDQEHTQLPPAAQQSVDALMDKNWGTAPGVFRAAFANWVESEGCVATDDPRLKD